MHNAGNVLGGVFECRLLSYAVTNSTHCSSSVTMDVARTRLYRHSRFLSGFSHESIVKDFSLFKANTTKHRPIHNSPSRLGYQMSVVPDHGCYLANHLVGARSLLSFSVHLSPALLPVMSFPTHKTKCAGPCEQKRVELTSNKVSWYNSIVKKERSVQNGREV